MQFAARNRIPVTFGAYAPGERGGEFVLQRTNAAFMQLVRGRRFADGGGVGTDKVPAMLTPGEYVVSRPAVVALSKAFGASFLPAFNAMRIEPGMLEHLLNPLPPPMPRMFAAGGYVGAPPPVARAPAGAGDTRNITVTLNANAGERTVARKAQLRHDPVHVALVQSHIGDLEPRQVHDQSPPLRG